MKKSVLVFFAGIILFSGCADKVTETVTYMINEPVFMSAQEFRESVKITTKAVVISSYGKICFDPETGFIYISSSETGGIHIVDNTDPSNPKNVGFIEMIGNADLSIREGKLYADALIDLVWFDISNPASPKLEGRLENVFSKHLPLPQTDNEFSIDYSLAYGMEGSKGVVVGWELKQRTETITYEMGSSRWWRPEKSDGVMRLTGADGIAFSAEKGGGNVGINGSMSRFAIYKDYLYTVINNYMSVIDLSGSEPVKAADNIHIGWNVETIFSYKDNMFMGTPTGMLIYSVTDPLQPQFMSVVSHVFGCDPVVVEDDIAYVTIHSGNLCGQNANDLLIYDVSDVKNPKHIVTYAMTKPKGLGIDNGILFICDDGLKIFNAQDPQTIMANRLAHYAGMEGFDVIPFNNVLMMIADDGLYQYDYSDLSAINQISKITIVRTK